MDTTSSKEAMQKTAYATLGAPIVIYRKMKGFGDRLITDAQKEIDGYAVEGEKLTKQLKDRNVVEELEHRMHIDKVQDRVEQLRDQLENTLNNWRESFTPGDEEPAKQASTKKDTDEKAPATKDTAKKTPAKEAAAKKDTAKKTAAKKDPAKKTPAKAAASE